MTDYIDLSLTSNNKRIKLVSNGDGTYSIVAITSDDTYTTPTTTVIPVTSGNTLLIAANAARKYLLIDNVSDEEIYLGFGQPAILGSGIHLLADGSYEMLNNALYRGAIYAIHGVSGNKNVVVLEGV